MLELDDRIGSLEAGKDADCFLTDGDLLDPRTRVLATVVDGRGRPVPKGRQLDQTASDEVHALIGDGPHPRDMMIEYLHLIQDRHGVQVPAIDRSL